MKAILRFCAFLFVSAAVVLLCLDSAHAQQLETQQLSPKLQSAVGHWQIINRDGKPGGKVDTYLVEGSSSARWLRCAPAAIPRTFARSAPVN